MELEAALAEDIPFGNHDFIDRCTWTRYNRRLKRLAEFLPVAEQTQVALAKAGRASRYRIIGDPIVRHAINAATAHFLMDSNCENLEDLTEVLAAAAQLLAENRSDTSPLQQGNAPLLRIGEQPHHAWIWRQECDDNAATRSFRQLLNTHLPALEFHTPDEQTCANLVSGTQLLEALLPQLGRSALNHAHLIGMAGTKEAWKNWYEHRKSFPMISITGLTISGAMFLAPSHLNTAWAAAEILLHEALHLKWYDLRHTHQMMRQSYHPSEESLIYSWWNSIHPTGNNNWVFCRSVAAFHVYVHLALFFQRIQQQTALQERFGPLGNLDPKLSERQSLDRARYLGEQVLEREHELGEDGREFLRWQLRCLDLLDASPREKGTYMHLLVDLYDRQCQAIERSMQRIARPAPEAKDMAQALIQVMEQELNLLQAFVHEGPVQDVLLEKIVSAFAATRSCVHEAIAGMSCQQSQQVEPRNQQIQEVLQSSDRTLNTSIWGRLA